MTPAATVVITTKNRCDELRIALRSAVTQSVPVELVVVDDGSADDTSTMVRSEFPTAVLIRRESACGYIAARNLAAAVASAEVVFSIDDDAAFSTPYILEQTLRNFDHPRVGAVAIPFINVHQDDVVRQRAPAAGVYVTASYIGTAHAVRRELFLRLGGYREHFVHQGEEGDFCLRMLAAGYVVRLGRNDPILHYESPKRDLGRIDLYGRRNDVLFAWHNVPLLYLPLHLAATTLRGAAFGVRVGRPMRMCHGLVQGYLDCLVHWRDRCPVPVNIYRLSRSLKKRGPVRLDVVEPMLPPLDESPSTTEPIGKNDGI